MTTIRYEVYDPATNTLWPYATYNEAIANAGEGMEIHTFNP